MKRSLKISCQKLPVVAGAVLLVFPNGVLWYWGNLSVLILSYFVSKLDQTSGVQTPWVVSLYIIFRVLGLLLYDLSKKICGQTWLVLIGTVISDAALFFCYFAVKNSLVLVNLALGACVGFGSGLLYGDALHAVVGLTDKHVGFLTCIIQGSFAAGAIIINEFVTLYVNPNNLSPDVHLGFSSYFTHKDVLDKVPIVFLFMGVFSVFSHAVAFILLNLHSCVGAPSATNSNGEKESLSQEDSTASSYQALGDTKDDGKNSLTSLDNSNKDGNSSLTSPYNFKKDGNTSLTSPDNSNTADTQKDYTPKEMFKTLTFASMWFAYFVGDFPLLLAINYYKSFGQMWIHDDHFLTALGTTILFFNAWLRSVWGIVVDRYGVKTTLVLLLGPLIVTNVWFYYSAMYSKWVYFFTAFLFSSLAAGLFSIFPAVVALVFGKTHFSVNYGLLTSASILFNLVGPVGLEAILSHTGWFVTLSSSSGLNMLALLLLLKYVPQKSSLSNRSYKESK